MKKIRMNNYKGFVNYAEFYRKDMTFTGRYWLPSAKMWFNSYRDMCNYIDKKEEL